MTELSITLGLLLFLICTAIPLSRGRKYGRVTLLDFSLLAVGLVYGLGWALVLTFTTMGYNRQWPDQLLPHKVYYLLNTGLAFILAACIYFGWRLSPVSYRVGARLSSAHLVASSEALHLYAWVLLAISIFLRWLYTLEYGGFVDYLDYSAAIRSSIFEIENKWSFLQPFSQMAIFSTFLFFSALVGGNRSLVKIIGFGLSCLFSIYILYSLLGRMGFLIFVASLILAVSYLRHARPTVLIAGSLIGGIVTIILAYLISKLLQLKSADNMPEYVARELSFPFVSFFAQLESGEYLYRWYLDFIYVPLYFLPSSWWSQWIEEVSQINTSVVMGAPKGELGVTGGVPVDLITLGLMQSSVFGVVVVGFLFGVMLRFLQGFSEGIKSRGLRAIIWSYIAIRVAVFAVPYSHPLHLISGVFGIAFSIALLAAVSNLRRIRISRR